MDSDRYRKFRPAIHETLLEQRGETSSNLSKTLVQISSNPDVEDPFTLNSYVEDYSLKNRYYTLKMRGKFDYELDRSILSVLDTGAGPSLI